MRLGSHPDATVLAFHSLLIGVFMSVPWVQGADTSDLIKPLKITTVIMEPYVISKWPNKNTTKSSEYKGFIIDILNEISGMLKFKYELIPAPDGKFGHREGKGKWNGMIGEILEQRADLAAAPLFNTPHRSRVVDFSTSYLKVRATLLLRKPPPGQELAISSAADLVHQSEIKYGTLNTGILLRAFKRTNQTVTRIMWRTMQRFGPSVLTATNEEGISKVRKEKYAFILPSPIGDYIARRKPCDLITVDRFLIDQGYTLAFPKKSFLLPRFDEALTVLNDTGVLKNLYDKWWVHRGDCNGIKTSKIYSVTAGCKSQLATLHVLLLSALSFTVSCMTNGSFV